MISDQEELIRRRHWDNLIILDACRYDYFEQAYEDHIEGDLKKVESPVSPRTGYATSDWCKKVFTQEWIDIVYFSSTPRVNSQSEVDGFSGSEKFGRIIDIWESGWDKEIGTVRPTKINDAVLSEDLGKNQIIHYLQPHFPYLGMDNPEKGKNNSPDKRNGFKYKLKMGMAPYVKDFLSDKRSRQLIDFLGLPPINHMDEVLRDVGEEGLKDAYRENLVIVLESVSDLVDELEGKTVITSDHGELLGEAGYYGHSYVPDHPKIRNVPWFVVEKD